MEQSRCRYAASSCAAAVQQPEAEEKSDAGSAQQVAADEAVPMLGTTPPLAAAAVALHTCAHALGDVSSLVFNHSVQSEVRLWNRGGREPWAAQPATNAQKRTQEINESIPGWRRRL